MNDVDFDIIIFMKRLIIILGPTATGKTRLSVQLAQAIDGEIISADSRQVYRGMDIGTAKIITEEMKNIPHHMIDVADPLIKTFTVADYVELGRKKIHDVYDRKKTPIIVGGTGMYIDALVGRLSIDGPEPDPQLRFELEGLSLSELQNRLQALDSNIFNSIDTNNKVRLISAIERCILPPRSRKFTQLPNDIEITWIGLALPKDVIQERIHARNERRIENGLIDEVKSLHEAGISRERMEEFGLEYRYVSRFVRGEILTKEELIQTLDTKTWQYAKRQMTWFKRNKDIQWFDSKEVNVEDIVNWI